MKSEKMKKKCVEIFSSLFKIVIGMVHCSRVGLDQAETDHIDKDVNKLLF